MVPARIESGFYAAFVALNAVHVALATGSQDAVGLQTACLHDIYQVPVKRKADGKNKVKIEFMHHHSCSCKRTVEVHY